MTMKIIQHMVRKFKEVNIMPLLLREESAAQSGTGEIVPHIIMVEL